MAAQLFITAAAAALTAILTGSAQVHLAGGDVHAADVAQLRGPGFEVAAKLVIAHMTGTAQTVGRAEIVQLLKRAIPSLEVVGVGSGTVRLDAPRRAASEPSCFESTVPIAVGEAIDIEKVRAVRCDPARTAAAAVMDVNRGLATAAAVIPAGGYFGRLLIVDRPQIETGDTLSLIAASGPVTIMRQVKALQPARTGQRRLFVRAEDGTVFSAPLVQGPSK